MDERPCARTEAQDLLLQRDGKIVVAAQGDLSKLTLIRLNPNGTLDSSFGTGGIDVVDFIGTLSSLAFDGFGRIVGVGKGTLMGSLGTGQGGYLLRFGVDGGVVLVTAIDVARSVAVQEDGRIVVSGPIVEEADRCLGAGARAFAISSRGRSTRASASAARSHRRSRPVRPTSSTG